MRILRNILLKCTLPCVLSLLVAMSLNLEARQLPEHSGIESMSRKSSEINGLSNLDDIESGPGPFTSEMFKKMVEKMQEYIDDESISGAELQVIERGEKILYQVISGKECKSVCELNVRDNFTTDIISITEALISAVADANFSEINVDLGGVELKEGIVVEISITNGKECYRVLIDPNIFLGSSESGVREIISIAKT